MSIQEIVRNIKRFLTHEDTFLALVLVLVALASFGLGRASVGGGEVASRTVPEPSLTGALIQNASRPTETSERVEGPVKSGDQGEEVMKTERYVASKSGTKYHLPWCPGASQIKEENKIWFDSKDAAEKAGYTPASNCKGI